MFTRNISSINIGAVSLYNDDFNDESSSFIRLKVALKALRAENSVSCSSSNTGVLCRVGLYAVFSHILSYRRIQR